MNLRLLTIAYYMLMGAGGVMALYGLYFCIVALFGFKRPFKPARGQSTTRFALLVAARNEATVIGNLVDSLYGQNYPSELFDVYVAPNNCTDDTLKVAQKHGALIFEAEGPISGKGEVLTQFCAKALEEAQYDAVCVFDADNLVHPDFLQVMNDACRAGATVAQGFRDSKNPADTAVSTCYSVCYWMVNRFYNGGRQALGLSALVNGSGFMVTLPLLKKLGGWNTSTMTEDYEFSAQCVLAGERVWYLPEAVIYDEQPLTFFQSWKQRRRWSTGSVQGMSLYLRELIETGIKQRNWACIDLAITYMMPVTQLVSLVLGLATLLVASLRLVGFGMLAFSQLVLLLILAAVAAFFVCALLAAFVIRLNSGQRSMQGTGKGVLYFALFLLSWLPIGIISLFKPKTTWDAIAHTCTTAMSDME